MNARKLVVNTFPIANTILLSSQSIGSGRLTTRQNWQFSMFSPVESEKLFLRFSIQLWGAADMLNFNSLSLLIKLTLTNSISCIPPEVSEAAKLTAGSVLGVALALWITVYTFCWRRSWEMTLDSVNNHQQWFIILYPYV